MTHRWLVRSALGTLLLCSLLGCATDATEPLSLDAGTSGVGIKATPNTLKGTAGSLFGGNTGVVFSVSGGAAGASYFWTVEGSVPSGLAFFPPTNSTPSTTLTLFGTPSEGGLYPLTITVHTAPGHVQFGPTANFPIEIAGDSNSAPEIPSVAIMWLTGVTYQQALTATGGKTPYASWFQTGLPAEITLDSKTGILSGTPSTPGTFNVTVSVLDAAGRMGIGTVSLTVKTWTLADAKGTWTGLINTGPLTGQRLSFLFNDVGVAQQATMDSKILATTTQVLPFTIGTDPPYTGLFNGPIFALLWHLVCTPTSSGDLDCIGHDFSGANANGAVTLSRISAESQDLEAPTVVSGVFAAAAADGTGGPRVTVTFSELMSGPGAVGTSITLTGGTATVDTPTFPATDPAATGARTLTIPLLQLQNSTPYTLTLNPSGNGFLDLAGNALAKWAISFTTGNLNANRPPTANALTLSATVDRPRPITLTGSDPENGALTFTVLTQPTAGTLTGTAPNLTYTSSVIGRASFTFTVTDPAFNTSLPATITIDTREANRPPIASSQTVSVVHDRSILITLTGTDPDAGDYLIAYTVTRNPTSERPLTGAGATKTYTPNPGSMAPDSFEFTVTDSFGDPSVQPATVTINVTNQPPTASPQVITVARDTTTAITLAASDPDGDTLTYTVVDSVPSNTHGTLTTGTGTTRTYTPPPGFSGTDTFTYIVSDGVASITTTLTITVSTNPPPTANPQTFLFTKRQGLTPLYKAQFAITLTGSASAVGFRIITWPLHQDPTFSMNMATGTTYQIVDPVTGAIAQGTATTSSSVDPTTGVITASPPGSPSTLIYTPNICHDIFAQDTFTFVAIDSDGLTSAPATVTMNSTTNNCSH
jgi:hypothetical protein